MSVHYKFKSSLDYNTVTFDGLHISVADFKKAIMQQNRIGKSADFDLRIENAETKEAYRDDQALIPKNTSVLVFRVPLANPPKRSWDRRGGEGAAVGPIKKAASFGKDANLSQLEGTESDKIKAMMAQSTQEYDPSNYVKIRGANQMGDVPMNYRCHKCHQPGHWIRNCPLGSTQEHEIKKSTGIPSSFMIIVDGPSVPGARLTPAGHYAVPAIDHQAYKEGKKEKPPFSKDPEPEIKKPEPPADLICKICKDLMTDAIMVPCCGDSYCDECIRNHLLDLVDNPNQKCPDCGEENVSPANLIPNRYLRTSVENFKKQCRDAALPLLGKPGVTEPSSTSEAPTVITSASPLQVPTEQQPEPAVSSTGLQNNSQDDDTQKSPNCREEKISSETVTRNSTSKTTDQKLDNQGPDAAKPSEEKSPKTENSSSVAPALAPAASPNQETLEQQPEPAAALATCDLVEPPPPPGTEPVPIPEVDSWPSRNHDLDYYRDRDVNHRMDNDMHRRRNMLPRNYGGDHMMGNRSYGDYGPGENMSGYQKNMGQHQHYDRRRSNEDRPATPTVDEPRSHLSGNQQQPLLPFPPGEDRIPMPSYGRPPPPIAHTSRDPPIVVQDPYMNRSMPPIYPQVGGGGQQQQPSGGGPPPHHYDQPLPAVGARYDRPLYPQNYNRAFHHQPPRNFNNGPMRNMRGMQHHGRDYSYRGQPAPPGLGRSILHNAITGVIDDPVAAFEMIMQQRDERNRHLGKPRRRFVSRSRSRSYSRSRSPSFDRPSPRPRSRSPIPAQRKRSPLSMSHSRHPLPPSSSSHRRNSRSPTPPKRRWRSGSFSISRSRSYSPRDRSRSPRGSPYRDRERGRPKEREREREIAPPRYRSPPPSRSPGRPHKERERERGRSRERRDSASRDKAPLAPRNPPSAPRQQQQVAPLAATASTLGAGGGYPPPLMSFGHSRTSPQDRKDYYDSYNRHKEDSGSRHRVEEKSRDRRDRDRRGDQHEAPPGEKELQRDRHDKYERHAESSRKRSSKSSPTPQYSTKRRSETKESTNTSTISSGEHVKKKDKEYEEKQSVPEVDKKKEKKAKDKKRKKDSEESSSFKKEKKKKKKEKKVPKESSGGKEERSKKLEHDDSADDEEMRKEDDTEESKEEKEDKLVAVDEQREQCAATESSLVQEFGNKLLVRNPEPPELSDHSEESKVEGSPQQQKIDEKRCIANPPNPKPVTGIKDNEFLAEVPELSKWEREETAEKSRDDDDVTLNSTVDKAKIAVAEEDAIVATAEDGTKVVTSEVLKRAENAIFQKAINAIRPIEIKKISDSRKVLYQNPEAKVANNSEVVEAARKDMNVTINVARNDRNVEIVADSSTGKKPKMPTMLDRSMFTPVLEGGGGTCTARLSAKERLGDKVKEPKNSETCSSDRPDSTTSRTVSPNSSKEAAKAVGKEKLEMPSKLVSADRKVYFDDRKREPEKADRLEGGKRQISCSSSSRAAYVERQVASSQQDKMKEEKQRIPGSHSSRSSRSQDRRGGSTTTPPPMIAKRSQAERKVSPVKGKASDEDEDRRRRKDKRNREEKKRKREHRSRSRSHQDRKKRKKHKRGKSRDRSSPGVGSGDANDEKKKLKREGSGKEKTPGKSVEEPAEDESKKAQRKNSLKNATDRKRNLLDEANFEPDYSAASLSESEVEQEKAPIGKKMRVEQHEKKAEGKRQKKKKRPAKSSSSDDDSSSAAESSSDSDSSDSGSPSQQQRKKRSGKKKHGKNKKKKRSKKESSTDESDSDSSDSSSDGERRASRKRSKKSKRKKQKRSKLRHKS